ncbi:hypothetical protein CGCS363_v008866 [Colletotrichum siamense]|uniref:uncharacterized protein n=1 Tax=Colletotrichum siamense TaxID=690259 RepID=UPI0018722577|nr:uncharacterized protein CGCS363_v008866 [Colletotrichum siamense]KAF5497530.1 hypothetical protein CGCS363_v008866 [Colletotrichum siamense]
MNQIPPPRRHKTPSIVSYASQQRMETSLLLSQMPLRASRKQRSTTEDEPAVRSRICKLEGLDVTFQRVRTGIERWFPPHNNSVKNVWEIGSICS